MSSDGLVHHLFDHLLASGDEAVSFLVICCIGLVVFLVFLLVAAVTPFADPVRDRFSERQEGSRLDDEGSDPRQEWGLIREVRIGNREVEVEGSVGEVN